MRHFYYQLIHPWVFIRKTWRKLFWNKFWYQKLILNRMRYFIGKSTMLSHHGWVNVPKDRI